MMRISWFLILINLVLVLAFFNYSIAGKEQLMKQGKVVQLKLITTNPPSLRQEFYMQLRYEISQGYLLDSISKRGFAVVKLDSNSVAVLVRFQQHKTPLNSNEHLIEYTINNNHLNIGAESFFFQEGKAARYDSAWYGTLRIDNDGNSIITGLCNRRFQPL